MSGEPIRMVNLAELIAANLIKKGTLHKSNADKNLHEAEVYESYDQLLVF